MKLIERVMNNLNVTVGEHFAIAPWVFKGTKKDIDGRIFKFDYSTNGSGEIQLMQCNGDRLGYVPNVLLDLLNVDEEHAITKIPFKPKEGEKYFYISFGGNKNNDKSTEAEGTFNAVKLNSGFSYGDRSNEVVIFSSVWGNDVFDFLAYYVCNCFRTKEQAEYNKINMYMKLTKSHRKDVRQVK